jgi:hypothetical protein
MISHCNFRIWTRPVLAELCIGRQYCTTIEAIDVPKCVADHLHYYLMGISVYNARILGLYWRDLKHKFGLDLSAGRRPTTEPARLDVAAMCQTKQSRGTEAGEPRQRNSAANVMGTGMWKARPTRPVRVGLPRSIRIECTTGDQWLTMGLKVIDLMTCSDLGMLPGAFITWNCLSWRHSFLSSFSAAFFISFHN